MVEKECYSFNSSAASKMDIIEQDKKDVSQVFTYLRNKLNAKEKELLELQRAEPCLLAPDSKQIATLIDNISSLHLSTQDGSFIFASTSKSDDSTSSSCSTGVESIKTLPSTIWLPKSNSVKEEKENEYRLPMVTHLLSLPFNAYVTSSSNHSTLPSFNTNDQPSYRLPMVNQLFSMPLDAFRSSSSSSNNQPTPLQIEEKKETVNDNNNNNNKVSTPTEPPKSILSSEAIYSKEHWLKKSSPSENESVPLNLDAYIEQSTDKMRRLHMEYVEALEKLKSPINPVNPPEMIKSMYPQMFDRINSDTSTKGLTRLLPSNK